MSALKRYPFPKEFRLLRRGDFRRVYEQGRRRTVPLCTAFILPNARPATRLGITAPRALGSAVLRSRIRRRLREVFRLNRAVFETGYDIVLNPRPAAATAPFAVLEREVLRLIPARPETSSREQSRSGPVAGTIKK